MENLEMVNIKKCAEMEQEDASLSENKAAADPMSQNLENNFDKTDKDKLCIARKKLQALQKISSKETHSAKCEKNQELRPGTSNGEKNATVILNLKTEKKHPFQEKMYTVSEIEIMEALLKDISDTKTDTSPKFEPPLHQPKVTKVTNSKEILRTTPSSVNDENCAKITANSIPNTGHAISVYISERNYEDYHDSNLSNCNMSTFRNHSYQDHSLHYGNDLVKYVYDKDKKFNINAVPKTSNQLSCHSFLNSSHNPVDKPTLSNSIKDCTENTLLSSNESYYPNTSRNLIDRQGALMNAYMRNSMDWPLATGHPNSADPRVTLNERSDKLSLRSYHTPPRELFQSSEYEHMSNTSMQKRNNLTYHNSFLESYACPRCGNHSDSYPNLRREKGDPEEKHYLMEMPSRRKYYCRREMDTHCNNRYERRRISGKCEINTHRLEHENSMVSYWGTCHNKNQYNFGHTKNQHDFDIRRSANKTSHNHQEQYVLRRSEKSAPRARSRPPDEEKSHLEQSERKYSFDCHRRRAASMDRNLVYINNQDQRIPNNITMERNSGHVLPAPNYKALDPLGNSRLKIEQERSSNKARKDAEINEAAAKPMDSEVINKNNKNKIVVKKLRSIECNIKSSPYLTENIDKSDDTESGPINKTCKLAKTKNLKYMKNNYINLESRQKQDKNLKKVKEDCRGDNDRDTNASVFTKKVIETKTVNKKWRYCTKAIQNDRSKKSTTIKLKKSGKSMAHSDVDYKAVQKAKKVSKKTRLIKQKETIKNLNDGSLPKKKFSLENDERDNPRRENIAVTKRIDRKLLNFSKSVGDQFKKDSVVRTRKAKKAIIYSDSDSDITPEAVDESEKNCLPSLTKGCKCDLIDSKSQAKTSSAKESPGQVMKSCLSHDDQTKSKQAVTEPDNDNKHSLILKECKGSVDQQICAKRKNKCDGLSAGIEFQIDDLNENKKINVEKGIENIISNQNSHIKDSLSQLMENLCEISTQKASKVSTSKSDTSMEINKLHKEFNNNGNAFKPTSHLTKQDDMPDCLNKRLSLAKTLLMNVPKSILLLFIYDLCQLTEQAKDSIECVNNVVSITQKDLDEKNQDNVHILMNKIEETVQKYLKEEQSKLSGKERDFEQMENKSHSFHANNEYKEQIEIKSETQTNTNIMKESIDVPKKKIDKRINLKRKRIKQCGPTILRDTLRVTDETLEKSKPILNSHKGMSSITNDRPLQNECINESVFTKVLTKCKLSIESNDTPTDAVLLENIHDTQETNIISNNAAIEKEKLCTDNIINNTHFKVFFGDPDIKKYVCCINGNFNHFKTASLNKMRGHIEKSHLETWDGYCHICQKNVTTERQPHSFVKCLEHMCDNHLYNFPSICHENLVISEGVSNLRKMTTLDKKESLRKTSTDRDQLSSDFISYTHFKVNNTDGQVKEYVCCINGYNNHYRAKLKVQMRKHVKAEHFEVWDGYCSVCKKNVMPCGELTFTDCLDHMFANHLDDFTVLDPVEVNKNDGIVFVNLDAASKTYKNIDREKDQKLPLTEKDINDSEAHRTDPVSIKKLSVGKCIIIDDEEVITQPALFDHLPYHASIKKNIIISKLPYKYEEHQAKIMAAKHSSVCNSMLIDQKLIQIYKCGGRFCTYSTNLPNLAEIHANTHHKSNVSDANILLCVYCDFDCKGIAADLVKHVFKSHGHCKYACSQCFYRAVADQLVLSHMHRVHRSTTMILETESSVCHDVEEQLPQDIAIQHYVCNNKTTSASGCERPYFSQGSFVEHLRNHDAPYYCSVCAQSFDQGKYLLQHMSDLHGLKQYQCTWCSGGADDEENFLAHFSAHHPTKKPQAYLRNVPGMQEEKSPIMVLPLVELNNTKLETQLVILSATEENPVTEADKANNLQEIITSIDENVGGTCVPSSSHISSQEVPMTIADHSKQKLLSLDDNNVTTKQGEDVVSYTASEESTTKKKLKRKVFKCAESEPVKKGIRYSVDDLNLDSLEIVSYLKEQNYKIENSTAILQEKTPSYPKYITATQRYACGAKGCSFMFMKKRVF